MIQWGKLLKALTKLKTFSKVSGVTGIFISTWEAIARFANTLDPIQLGVDIAIIFLDLDRQIYIAVEQLQTASNTEMIWLGLGIYGKIWLLTLILRLLSKPFKDTVISEDTPKIPVMMFYGFMFLMILTPLQILGQVFSVLLDTGTFAWADMNPPWRGLLAVIFNIPTVLEPLYHMAVAIIEWIPWTEAELSNPENLTDENITHMS